MSSMSPVYSRMPALMLSKTPFVIKVVALPGERLVRAPRPAAMAMGVVRP